MGDITMDAIFNKLISLIIEELANKRYKEASILIEMFEKLTKITSFISDKKQ